MHLATNQVVHDNLAVFGDHETHGVRHAFSHQFVDLFLAHRQAVAQVLAALAVVDEGLFVGFGLLAVFVQLLSRIEGNISAAFGQQLVAVLLVEVLAVALLVGAVLATNVVAFVELDAAPVERLDDILLGTRHETRLVRILDAENHLATVLLGKQVII